MQDALLATLMTATSLVGVLAHLHVDLPEGSGDAAARNLDALGVTLVLLQTVPLVWRRRAPVSVLAVTMAALFALSALGYFRSFASLGPLLALFTVAAYSDRRTSIRAGIASTVLVLLIVIMGKEAVEPDAIISEFLIVGAVWFIGDGFRIQRSQMVQLEDRATRLEREREVVAQRAVAEERRVIARELHDVVAHNVSVVVAQAGAAQRIFATQPEEVYGTLGAIEQAGREALVEMRRLMGLLRTRSDPDEGLAPQPGLGHLDLLVVQVREAGLPVELRIEGDPRALPAGLDLSAFRIVQEALTNVMKHAGPARAGVVVRYEPSRLVLTVVDDGLGPDPRIQARPRPRYGHLGMRERVALFGGELHLGPRPGGGFQVVAALPLEGGPA